MEPEVSPLARLSDLSRLELIHRIEVLQRLLKEAVNVTFRTYVVTRDTDWRVEAIELLYPQP
jgi:hypothetical protein